MENSADPTLSERLKATRGLRGLSQDEVAEMLGVTQPTYNRWELGRTGKTLTHELMDRLADFLGISREELAVLIIDEQIALNER